MLPKKNQILKMKKLSLNLKLKFKRKSFKGNLRAEWVFHNRFLEPSIRSNPLSLLKFQKAQKLNSWSNLSSETLSFSRILIGKMKKLSSKPCQKKNSKAVRLSSKREKMETSFSLFRVESMTVQRLLKETRPTWKATNMERLLENLLSCTMLQELQVSHAKLLERFTLLTELSSIKLSRKLHPKKEIFSKTFLTQSIFSPPWVPTTSIFKFM